MEGIKKGLEGYEGVDKRFQHIYTKNGIIVLDDYAHHPGEIKNALETVLKMKHNKIHVVFQSHTYTRTRALFQEFSECFDDMDTLQELQRWYQSQCNGDWEHSYGVKIDTLDNPGWSVTIELIETDMSDRPFTAIQRLEHDKEWIYCEVRDQKFEGRGGPFMLEEILRTFVEWAAPSQTV